MNNVFKEVITQRTVILLHGLSVYIIYSVTADNKIAWWLDLDDEEQKDTNLMLLEFLLRKHYSAKIENEIREEYQAKIYAEEQAYIARLEDLPF